MEIQSGEPGKAKRTLIFSTVNSSMSLSRELLSDGIVRGHMRGTEIRWIRVWVPISVWLGVMKPDGRHKINI